MNANHVGVLLDGAADPQVRELRPVLGRFSTMRLIWEQAITEASISPASTFRAREISVISCTRLAGTAAVPALDQPAGSRP